MKSVKVVKVSIFFKVIKILIYLILLVIAGLMFFPDAPYGDLIFKVLFAGIFVLGIIRFFGQSFNVIGGFEYSHDRLRLVIGKMSKEIKVKEVDEMSILINSYIGKPVGLSLRTHHGADNKIDIIADGNTYSFLFQLESHQDFNSLELIAREWASINRNVAVRKSVL